MLRSIQPRKHAYWQVMIMWVALLISGCAGREAAQATPVATPTISPLFLDPVITPTAIPTPTVPIKTPITLPTDPAAPTLTPTPVTLERDIAKVSVYDDTLNTNWSLSDSLGMRVNPAATAFVYAGKKALAATPQQAYGQLQFSVKPESKVPYQRDGLLGISFWLGSGDHTISPQDLVVSIHGSNSVTYWKVDDASVQADHPVSDIDPLFPETRLYFIHINQNIPPKSWVQVILWFADHDDIPDYKYVTAILIKNDELFRDTFYVDDLQLLTAK